MLDVHPPHHAVQGWRDFLIHIATIVVGLLIAVGIEHVVTMIHQHHQVSETREALEKELDKNREVFRKAGENFEFEVATLENNLLGLLYLKDHPGASADKLPVTLDWQLVGTRFSFASWNTAQHGGVLALMSQDEQTSYTDTYTLLKRVDDSNDDVWRAVLAARRYIYRDSNPAHLSSSQVDEEINLTLTAMMAIDYHYDLLRFASNSRGFPPPPPAHLLETLRTMHKRSRKPVEVPKRSASEHTSFPLPLCPPNDPNGCGIR